MTFDSVMGKGPRIAAKENGMDIVATNLPNVFGSAAALRRMGRRHRFARHRRIAEA